MIFKIDPNTCIGCGVCVKSCSVSAIKQDDDKYIINTEVCIGCGICAGNCPLNAISNE
ncbi:MAG: 4Fe-4S binding protein [Endomicrobium sp.]|jgi:ferredoxin|nr:4Fe-4S binding protein [Endomicrobium sp.]